MYKELIESLRLYSIGYNPPDREEARRAADAIENLVLEVKALNQICEKQSYLNQRIAELALELDQAKAEIEKLNMENFWLSKGE